MNLNIETYKIFDAIVKEKSITKAAIKLHISQPAVSQAIKQLEDNLGGQLFVRTRTGVVLTSEGQELYNYVDTALNLLKNGENRFNSLKKLETGIIRIGASATISKFILIPILNEYHKKYPNIEIQILNHLTEELVKKLKDGSLDILFLNLPTKETTDLKITTICEVNDIFVCNKEIYDKLPSKILLEQINDLNLITQKKPSNTRNYLDNFMKQNGIILKPKTEIVSYNLVIEFAKIGFGIAYATKEFIKKELETKALFEINVSPKVPKREIGVVTMNKSIPSFATKKLLEITKNFK